jgi:predicted nuclease of predicted toxin-antitoxin system
MLRLLFDENFDQRILRGLRLRVPQLDYVIVQHAGMSGFSDPVLLDWAANEGRIVITHDVNTITRYANERMKQGRPMPGVVIVPDDLEIGRAIADLEIIIESDMGETLVDQIQFLPL